MEKWIIITNPAAATETAGSGWKQAEKVLVEGGVEFEARLTEKPGHAIELAKEAAAQGSRKLIAGGGDGTIHEVMTGLLRFCEEKGVSMSEFTLAVLPLGTGNDWIRTANVPADVKEAAACIVRGNIGKEDVVKLSFADGVYCMANIGGIGLDADICINTNTLKKRGHKGGILYSLVAPYSIFSKKCRPVVIECDGEKVYEGKLYTAVLGNGIYRGGGLKQTAEGSSWSDGLLEVSIMPGVNHFKGMSQMMHIFKGDFATLPGIISKRFKKMTVKPLSDKADAVEIDGEIPGTIPCTVELTGEQISIIVP